MRQRRPNNDFSDLKELLDQGNTINQIAKIKNCSVHSIYQAIKRKNIDFISVIDSKKNLTGYKWAGMEVLSRDDIKIIGGIGKTKKVRFWKIKCFCGNILSAHSNEITSNKRKSCGCIRTEKGWKINRRSRKGYMEMHGGYWRRIIEGAKTRGLDFLVSIEYAWELFILQNKKCKLSGVDIGFGIENGESSLRDTTASLDRIDSSLGYIEGNIQWVHKKVNLMKQNLNEAEFKYFCRMITNNE
jgi:hypothetical protein